MLKPVLTFAAAAAAGVVLWKVLSFLLVPLLGTLLGFVTLLVKIAVVVGLVWLALWFFRRRPDGSNPPGDQAPESAE
jgi:threonine/homoserine/homoserine lactone efflux protein